jgi:hypothetical protein
MYILEKSLEIRIRVSLQEKNPVCQVDDIWSCEYLGHARYLRKPRSPVRIRILNGGQPKPKRGAWRSAGLWDPALEGGEDY